MNKTYSEAIKIPSIESSIKDYFLLMKPRVMALVIFTFASGLWLAPGYIHPLIAFIAILCTALGAGSAASVNMWYDRDIDAIMQRTKNRPLVVGSVEPEEALSFGIVLGFLSISIMAICINLLSALLLAITILYYIFVYTMWLKRSSPQNVVIGGVAGSLPPLIGWSSVTNNLSAESFVLFMIIFVWTPPHSWALALYRLEEYRQSSIPMLPVNKGKAYTKKYIVFYSVLMVLISIIPFFLKMSNIIYLFTAFTLGLIFLYYVFNLFRDETNQAAKKLFCYSIVYLFMIFLSLDILQV